MRFVLTFQQFSTSRLGFSRQSDDLLIPQQWTWRILETLRRHKQRPRRVRIAALIDARYVFGVLRIFGKRLPDVDRSSDSHKRVQAGRRFAMHSHTAMRPRRRPDKTFVKSVGWRERTPISHRVTGVRLANAAFSFVLFDNREVARWCFSAATANIRLCGH